MDKLFINVYQKDNQYFIDIETYVTLFIFALSESPNIQLKVKHQVNKPNKPLLKITLNNVAHEVIQDFPEMASYCTWPAVLSNNSIISGLCSTARYIVKNSNLNDVKKLLGFREACLMACSESSVWTRYCEIDIINTVTDFWMNISSYFDDNVLTLPANICRFEYHMKQPVRMHNVYKVARISNKDASIESSTPINELNLSHCFGEGPFMTLADVILYPCFNIFFSICPLGELQQEIPEICKWFTMMNEKMSEVDAKVSVAAEFRDLNIAKIVQPEFPQHSLYTADPNRYRPEKRIFTKQKDIDNSLKSLENLEGGFTNNISPYGHEIIFNWSEIPLDANPVGGALPEKRAGRKCEQLENLAKAVVKIAQDKKYKIVDFCSGSGHLGILMAYLLPKCTVILVENKEKSLERAIDRIGKLNLTNVQIVQSNLDYFTGSFDIGVALHACGVATDLVIQKCINTRAHFVVCPCCYGGIRDCHVLKYPRSDRFKSLDLEYKNYLSLAHAADQTHDKDNVKTSQGYKCMDVVDTDRRLYAESCGYQMHLGKLQPVSCTNKNNLLVGIFNNK